jgi:hypothetical protein
MLQRLQTMSMASRRGFVALELSIVDIWDQSKNILVSIGDFYSDPNFF